MKHESYLSEMLLYQSLTHSGFVDIGNEHHTFLFRTVVTTEQNQKTTAIMEGRGSEKRTQLANTIDTTSPSLDSVFRGNIHVQYAFACC